MNKQQYGGSWSMDIGLVKCPWCGYKRFDLIAGSCERRQCKLEFPIWPDDIEHRRELWRRAHHGDLALGSEKTSGKHYPDYRSK